jgi:NAD(P)-dependent dehydrogenase (short-subunit alcohol dehydrogenase family)
MEHAGQRGRIAVVTGGTSGIGRATADGLVERGYRVVLVGRNAGRGEQAVREISARAGEGSAEFEQADLSSKAQVRDLAHRVMSRHERVHVLINNHGAQTAQREVNEDGHEVILATNVINPLVLTLELRPALRAAAPSRVVFVSSDAHRFAKLVLEDLESERSFVSLRVYARAKLLQVLVARELAGQLKDDGISVFAVNPGAAWTEQTASMKPSMVPMAMRLYWPIMRLVQRRATPQRAARASIAAATDPALEGRTGLWLNEHGEVSEPSKIAQDDALATQVHDRLLALAR